jgi:hypothetical protein
MAIDNRSYSAGRFAMEVDRWNVGYMKKVSGFGMQADVYEHQTGPDNVVKKNVAKVSWTTGKVSVGIGMGLGMYQWIRASFDKSYQMRAGILKAGDFNYKCMSQLEFTDALITSVTVPKLDGASKDAAYFDVEFQPTDVKWSKGDNSDIRAKIGPKQKAWLCSNFAVEIGNLPCKRVSSVDTFTWKCSVIPDDIGVHRISTQHPAKVTVPDITLSISNADKGPWQDAAKKWFVDGNHLEGDEMTGRIMFLGPTMDVNKPIGEIELLNVGFKKFAGQDLEANSEKIDRFDVTLYVEQMKFKINEYDA